jgi:gas vesicle protein
MVVAHPLRRRNVRRKVLILLAAAIVGLSGGVGCGQAVEDEVRKRVEEKVEQGKQRAKEEVEKGKQRLEREGQKAKKEIEQEVQKARKQAEDKAGTRR